MLHAVVDAANAGAVGVGVSKVVEVGNVGVGKVARSAVEIGLELECVLAESTGRVLATMDVKLRESNRFFLRESGAFTAGLGLDNHRLEVSS